MFLALPLVAAVGRPRGGGRGRADGRVRAGAALDEGHSVGGILQVAREKVQLGHLGSKGELKYLFIQSETCGREIEYTVQC